IDRATAWFRPWSHAPRIFAVDGGNVERFGVLRRVRMGGAGIDAQVAELHASKRPARQHAFYRFLHDPLRKFALEDRARGALLDAADIAGVVAIDLVFALLAGQHDFFRVDDDDIVAVIDVRGVGRFVLAAQPHRHQACETADHETGGFDDDPFLLDVGGLGRKGFHSAAFHSDWRIRLPARGSYTCGPVGVNAGFNILADSSIYCYGFIIPSHFRRAGSNTSTSRRRRSRGRGGPSPLASKWCPRRWRAACRA